MEFGIPGYDDLVWDVSLVCDRIGSSTQHGLNGKLHLGDTLTLGLASRSTDTDVITLPRTSLLHLQSYLSLARFILNFYVSCGCWLTCRQRARGGEAHRAKAAARHQGRSKRGGHKIASNSGGLWG